MPELNPNLDLVGSGFAAFLAPPGPEVVRFTVGQPDFDTPAPIVACLRTRLMRDGVTKVIQGGGQLGTGGLRGMRDDMAPLPSDFHVHQAWGRPERAGLDGRWRCQRDREGVIDLGEIRRVGRRAVDGAARAAHGRVLTIIPPAMCLLSAVLRYK